MRIVVAALFTALAFAGEPDIEKQTKPITINLENVDPKTAAKMMKDVAKLRVEFAPQAAEKRANVRLMSVPTAMGMTTIAEAFGCEVQFLGKRRWRITPAWQLDIFKKLESNTVTLFQIDKTPIEQFLAYVRAETRVDITLDRGVDRELKVAMRVSKITYRTLLDKLVKRTGVNWELRYGVVYIAKPERFKKTPVLPPVLKSPALLRVRMPLAFNRVSLKQLAPTLTQLMGVPFVVPEEMLTREVAAQATDVSLRQAFALMLYPMELTAVEKSGAVHVKALPGT